VKKSGAAGCCLRSSIEWDEKMKEMQEVSVKVYAIKGQGFVLVTLKTRKSNVKNDFFHSERSKELEDTKQQRA